MISRKKLKIKMTFFTLTLLMILLSLLTSSVNSAKILTNNLTDAQIVMNSLPPEDRAYFVTFHIAKEAEKQYRKDVYVIPGFERIPVEKYEEFMAIDVPHDFGKNLLDWTEKEMVSIDKRLMFLRADKQSTLLVCFPSGCVDPNDVGSNCCPF